MIVYKLEKRFFDIKIENNKTNQMCMNFHVKCPK